MMLPFVNRERGPSRACWGGKAVQTSEVDLPEFRFAPHQVGAPVVAIANVPNIRQSFSASGYWMRANKDDR
jgi:hypothetical protein